MSWRTERMEIPAPPTALGRYELLHRIAAGGMAEVYAARSIGAGGFQKLVAIKRMLPTLVDDERFVQMFMDEAKLASAIISPYAVQTLDLGTAVDGSLFIVMDLVRGASLGTLLKAAAKRREPLSVKVAGEILRQAALGLHDAHEARSSDGEPLELIHRDISPQNILVGIDGRVRITDFGVAKALHRATKTATGEIKGKMSYCSPEQVRGEELDRRSDIFSLGVVAWEALTHRRLFRRDNPAAILQAVLSDEIKSPQLVRSGVPAHVGGLVMTALKRNPDERYSTALEFADAIGAALGGSSSAQVASVVTELAGDQIADLDHAIRTGTNSIRLESTPPSAPSRRSWIPILLLTLIVAVLTAGITMYSLGDSEEEGVTQETDVASGANNEAQGDIVRGFQVDPSSLQPPTEIPATPVNGTLEGSPEVRAPAPRTPREETRLREEPAVETSQQPETSRAVNVSMRSRPRRRVSAMSDESEPPPSEESPSPEMQSNVRQGTNGAFILR